MGRRRAPAVATAICMGIWAALVPGTATAAAKPTAAGTGPPTRKQPRATELATPEKGSRLDIGSLSAAQGAIAGVRYPHGKRIGSFIAAPGKNDPHPSRRIHRRLARSILRRPDFDVHP